MLVVVVFAVVIPQLLSFFNCSLGHDKDFAGTYFWFAVSSTGVVDVAGFVPPGLPINGIVLTNFKKVFAIARCLFFF